MIIRSIKSIIRSINKAVFDILYYRIYYYFRIKNLRKQPIIKVAFKIEDLGAWKTEDLYKLMLQHPRFEPILIICQNVVENDLINLRQYCNSKGYDYIEIDGLTQDVWDCCYPDIVFFQKQYRGETFLGLRCLLKYHKTLFAHIPYGFRSSIEPWAYDWPYLHKSWQIYYENREVAEEYAKLVTSRRPNIYVTGLPMMDELLTNSNGSADPWKPSEGKKRIIYAPHHSINPDNLWISSTFLDFGEEILKLAEKYSDKVQWAFKPHPLLKDKLIKIWGEKRTLEYYSRWEDVEWSQYESGKYTGLFHHSDAMIHDCGSFIMEYLYTDKPVMYLFKDNHLEKTFNEQYKKALALHYHGWNLEDIEDFIKNVINDQDPMYDKRMSFKRKCLTPPYGKSASQNIIDCILNADADKKMLFDE